MCQILLHGKIEIETPRELRKLMPLLSADPIYNNGIAREDCCLCPVDLVATGKANGFLVVYDPGTDRHVATKLRETL